MLPYEADGVSVIAVLIVSFYHYSCAFDVMTMLCPRASGLVPTWVSSDQNC